MRVVRSVGSVNRFKKRLHGLFPGGKCYLTERSLSQLCPALSVGTRYLFIGCGYGERATKNSRNYSFKAILMNPQCY